MRVQHTPHCPIGVLFIHHDAHADQIELGQQALVPDYQSVVGYEGRYGKTISIESDNMTRDKTALLNSMKLLSTPT